MPQPGHFPGQARPEDHGTSASLLMVIIRTESTTEGASTTPNTPAGLPDGRGGVTSTNLRQRIAAPSQRTQRLLAEHKRRRSERIGSSTTIAVIISSNAGDGTEQVQPLVNHHVQGPLPARLVLQTLCEEQLTAADGPR